MSSGKADKDAMRERIKQEVWRFVDRDGDLDDAVADWVLDFARRYGERCVNEALLVGIFSEPPDGAEATADNAPDKRTAYNWGWSAACSQIREYCRSILGGSRRPRCQAPRSSRVVDPQPYEQSVPD